MQIAKYQPVLSKAEMELIHEKSLYLLENNGEIIESDEILEICKKAGFRVEGQRVYYPREKVEAALKQAPKDFKLRGRDGRKAFSIREDGTKLAPALGPMNVLEDGHYRPTTMKDMVDFTVLHETSSLMRTVGANMLRPRDLPLSPLDNAMTRLAITLAYSTKPLQTFCEGGEISDKSFEMIKQFYGGASDEDVYAMICISTASPFRLTQDTCETLLSFCRCNQLLWAQGSGMPGLTTPPTLAGTLLQGNAEKLGIITLSQTINPGNPVMYSLISMLSDLRYTSCVVATPESPYRMMAEKDMADFYGLPSLGTTGLADAKELDYQCGAEAFMMFYFAYHSSPDLVAQSLGVLDSYNTISYEKFIMDEENVQSILKLLLPVAIDEKRMKIDKILKAGPAGNYLARTDRAYREDFYRSSLYFKESSAEWMAQGRPSLEAEARKKYLERITEYQPGDFDQIQQKIIDQYIPKDLQLKNK